ncbi:hypothetical protein BST81_23850 [Leptolyngbya sp. 'hensonii']|nr:hypothetical protein BST81_23850 [Leptolyngbya sp. 'hensonii']
MMGHAPLAEPRIPCQDGFSDDFQELHPSDLWSGGFYLFCTVPQGLSSTPARLEVLHLRIVDLITPKFSALTPNPQPLPLSQRERGQGGEGNQEFIGVI